MIPIPEYRPDVSDILGASTQTVLNVLPRADGYGPMPDWGALSDALSAACRGGFYARKTDGSVVVFGATATRLYLLSNTDYSWSDVSKGGAAYSSVAGDAQWQFRQFGNYVVVVQENTVPQVYDLTSSSAFADLGGSPPQARYVEVVGKFLVLSGLLTFPYRIQWCGFDDITGWTAGVNQSDFQDFADGGITRGVSGGEYGVIFQDTIIRRMTYAPGSPVIFQIDKITNDLGILAPLSLTRAGERIFWLSAQGFKMLSPGGYPQPVGREKVDRTVLADIDTSNLQLCMGAADPAHERVFFTYKSMAGSAGNFDKALCYDIVLERFSPISLAGEYLSSLARPGITLEGLDAISTDLDALTESLDSYTSAAIAQLAMFDSDNKLGLFNGSNLEATVVTAEQTMQGQRFFVRSVRPITDAPSVYTAVSTRESLQATATYGSESSINTQGLCPQRASTRYARGKMRIPAATTWTYIAGAEPDMALEGAR